HNIGRGHRQLPSIIAVGKRKVDEGSTINPLLFLRDAINHPKLPGHAISRIRQKRKPEIVLVGHEERLLDCLRRNGDQRGTGGLDLRQHGVYCLELADAEWAPPSAEEANDQSAFAKQVSRRNQLSILTLHFEGGRLR